MPSQYDLQFEQGLRALDAKINATAGGVRKYVDDRIIKDLGAVLASLKGSRSGGGGFGATDGNGVLAKGGDILRLEDIPGRRVPFIYTVEIPIGATDTSERRGSFTITQDGPFVATRRMATFLSAHTFAYTDPETSQQTAFNGRSNGRFRPISSDSDFNDSQHAAKADVSAMLLASLATPTSPGMLTYAQASNISSFRTMGWDGYLQVINAGSSYPRQNRPVPSAFWAKSAFGAGIDLPALDFFERSEVVDIVVQATHPGNAPYGNAAGLLAWGGTAGTGFPFLAGQFDAHEGIATPDGVNGAGQSPVFLESDPITRLPDGILIVALEGYRIIQSPGAQY